MLPTALVNAGLFAWIAWRSKLPAAHLPAALSGVFGYLLLFHVGVEWGQMPWTGVDAWTACHVLVSGISGTALVLPAVLLALPLLLARRRSSPRRGAASKPRPESPAVWYAAAAGITAVASLALVAWHSLLVKNDEIFATWVYAVYAVGAILAAARTGKPSLGYAGGVLLWAAWAQGLAFRYADLLDLKSPWPYVFLAHASVSLLAALWFDRRETSRRGAAEPLAEIAQVERRARRAAVELCGVSRRHVRRGRRLHLAGGDRRAHRHAQQVARLVRRVSGLRLRRRGACGRFSSSARRSGSSMSRWAIRVRSTRARGRRSARRGPCSASAGWPCGGPSIAKRRRSRRRRSAMVPVCGARSGTRALRVVAAVGARRPDGRSGRRPLLVGLVVAMALYAVVPGVCQELSPRNLPVAADADRAAAVTFRAARRRARRAARAGLRLGRVGCYWRRSPAWCCTDWENGSARRSSSLSRRSASPAHSGRRPFRNRGRRGIGAPLDDGAAFCVLSIPLWLPRPAIERVGRGLGAAWSGDSNALRNLMFWAILGVSLLPQVVMLVGMAWAAVERHPATPEVWPALFACFVIAVVGGAMASILFAVRGRGTSAPCARSHDACRRRAGDSLGRAARGDDAFSSRPWP